MQEGIIIKGISGFYYVKIKDDKIIECKARGKFRKEKVTPIVGDRVIIDLIDEEHGVIDSILERHSELIRPLVANVDQAVVVFALKKPDISFTLLDKLLILIEHNNIDSIICFNKADLDDSGIFDKAKRIYENIGYRVIKTNAKTGLGISELEGILDGKISVFAGPSGVGKSTMFNRIQNKVEMETGEISEKISRGKHTTRHAELIEVKDNTYVVDTPGFSSIDLNFIEPEELQYAFKEFEEFTGKCKFTSCIHVKEKGCIIKDKVEEGVIPVERYNAYCNILDEIQEEYRRKRR